MASIFFVVALAALAIALVIPKRYDASTLLVVESGSTIKSLVEGRSVATGGMEVAAFSLQVNEGRKIPRELLLFGGFVRPPPAKQPDPREEARLLAQLRSRIKIDSPKEGTIRIAYNDTSPDRAYKMANKLAEIYIREAGEAQARQLREASDFIEMQVKEYGAKLATCHAQVLAHYRGLDAPDPTADAGIAPVAQPRITLSPEQLAALRTEKASLERQLGPKASAAVAESNAEDNRKVLQIQGELDRLLATYTDEHPDVKRLRRELAAAQEAQRVAEEARAKRRAEAQDTALFDDELRRAARIRLDAVNTRLWMAGGAPAQPTVTPPGNAAEVKPDPELRGIGQDATLSELLRRYEATRDVYQDLLKRRESARVSMELTAQNRGATIRVQEPAELPAAASGLRLMHACAAGLGFAVLLPVGVLIAIVRFDRRVRSPQQIEAFGCAFFELDLAIEHADGRLRCALDVHRRVRGEGSSTRTAASSRARRTDRSRSGRRRCRRAARPRTSGRRARCAWRARACPRSTLAGASGSRHARSQRSIAALNGRWSSSVDSSTSPDAIACSVPSTADGRGEVNITPSSPKVGSRPPPRFTRTMRSDDS